MWLSSKDLPLWVESCKLTPFLLDPFPISKVANPAAVWLRIPRSLRMHPIFHVAQVKLVMESSLVAVSNPHHLPSSSMVVQFVQWSGFLQFLDVVVVTSTWCTRRDTVVKRGAGFPPATLWTPLSSRTSAAILTGLGPQVTSLEEGVLSCFAPC